jgi:hypothetical protein
MIGIFSASVFSDLGVALAFLPLILLPLMIFSGLFVNNDSIPVYFNWIKYMSPMKYGFTALAENEFDGLTLQNCPPGAACTGEQVLANLGLGGELSIGVNIILILVIYFVLYIGSYFALWRLVHSK